ncbi:MAG: hypothetical protein OEZ59_13390, partial [Deltaproteobacteria bacterium]|nr:hypothetical protein [Deltaproteobacteria bacterium]
TFIILLSMELALMYLIAWVAFRIMRSNLSRLGLLMTGIIWLGLSLITEVGFPYFVHGTPPVQQPGLMALLNGLSQADPNLYFNPGQGRYRVVTMAWCLMLPLLAGSGQIQPRQEAYSREEPEESAALEQGEQDAPPALAQDGDKGGEQEKSDGEEKQEA